ncbi:pre-mRNA-splicing factor ISY1 homolog [Sander lucioperca]|uniref:pre-mRNA-splicing factor ISY1 homolog n=1 Tax=Sander lucioperca TaxID=283035 RepID=UPI001653539D|nr:pre-mRNA-splicing factor ISY1 homolog [Sander lucioperca]
MNRNNKTNYRSVSEIQSLIRVCLFCVRVQPDEEESREEPEGEEGGVTFIAHVPVPSQREVEEALVRRKKMELLQRYASETLQAQSQTAKTLLGL